MTGERRRFERNRLGWPGRFALQIRGRHRSFLDGKQRLPRFAVEHEYMTGLGDLSHRINFPAVASDRHQIGRRGQVAVPEIVVHELEMPHAPAGGCLEREQAVGVKVLPNAIAAPKIKRSRSGRDIDQTPFFIQRHARPAIRSTNVLPGVGGPGLVARLARIRNCVKRPDDLPGARVVSADVPGRGGARSFRHPVPENEQIAIDDARCGREHEKLAGVATQPFSNVHPAISTKPVDRHSRACIYGKKVMAGRKQNAAIGAVRPINNAAVNSHRTAPGAVREWIETPQLAPARGVERKQLQLRRRAVQYAIEDQRVALDL